MLGAIPIVGAVFTWVGHLVCLGLSGPPTVVIGTLKAISCAVLGGTCL